jgi:hypothetical protein
LQEEINKANAVRLARPIISFLVDKAEYFKVEK